MMANDYRIPCNSISVRNPQANACKKISLKSIVMNFNYLKDKHNDSLLELLQKYEEMIDRTLG